MRPVFGQTRTVIDGPFTETKELIAGYWLWQVNRWTRRSHGSTLPQPDAGDREIEIRPVFEMESSRN